MSAKNRAALITKLHKACKKKYQVVSPPSGRTVLEHLMYACCLEDSGIEAADEAFARLQSEYFDWNEVRVTTVAELASLCKSVSNPEKAASRIKKTLHGVFETYYSFEIETLKKENLGKAVGAFQKFKGVSPFVISYMAQNALGGHSIPVDESMLNLFYFVGVISEDERKKGKVPGLERTIPKTKGVEFASVVHQLAAQFTKSPFNKDTREFILSIDSTAKERFPKRGAKKQPEPEPEKKPAKEVKAEDKKGKTKKEAAKPAAKKKAPAKKTAPKSAPVKKAAVKKSAKKKVAKKKAAPKKKTPAKKKPAKKVAVKKAAKKSSPSKRLGKKKPR